MANSSLSVANLDFSDIKGNLKQYLQSQDLLKDYDFEGSNLSLLIDTLAYASHVSGVNTNIAASELFLDSAQIRKNVVSRAKDLGFTPATEKASSAIIDVQVQNALNADGSHPTADQMAIQRGHKFTTLYDGVNYEYVVSKTNTPIRSGNDFQYSDVEIVQGTYTTDTYVFDSQIKNSKFVL